MVKKCRDFDAPFGFLLASFLVQNPSKIYWKMCLIFNAFLDVIFVPKWVQNGGKNDSRNHTKVDVKIVSVLDRFLNEFCMDLEGPDPQSDSPPATFSWDAAFPPSRDF